MPRIIIDARMSGSGSGRYVDKLVEHLHKLKPEHDVILLAKSPRVSYLRGIAPDFKVVKSDFKEFTFLHKGWHGLIFKCRIHRH